MPKKNKGRHVAFRDDRGTWAVLEYVRGKRKWHSGGFPSREQAEIELARQILTQGQRNPASLTLGEIMAYYLDVRAPQLARPDHALFFNAKLKEFWANRKISEVTQGNIRLYHAHRDKMYADWQKKDKHTKEKTISSATIRREIEHLRACLNLAEADGLIPHAPKIKLPEKGESKTRWLTRKEVAKLIREARKLPYASTYLPHFIRLSLRTGARKSALLSLRWSQVDLKNQTIDFRPAQRSKTKGAGIAAIPDRQMPYIRALKKSGTSIGHVIHKYGKPILRTDKAFAEACKNAGLEDVTIHTLRHTFASWLKQDGASVSDIAEALGHRSTAMVDRVYAHMGTGYIDRLKKIAR